MDRAHDSIAGVNTEKLRSLKAQGFRYLETRDDGDTWTGSHDNGLPLETLLHLKEFRGHIVIGGARDARRGDR